MERRSLRFGGFAAAGVIAISLALTGCSSPTPEENVSQACTEAEALATAVEDFRTALTAESTVEEVRSARDAVVDAYETLMAEAQDVAQDRMDDLEASVMEFRSAVDDVPEDTALPDAVEDLRSEASDVGSSLDDLESDLTC
ncbi:MULTISPECIES: hypothetical protein [unclassified Arthrobacter]|uniref:hypothetical protein n=1 Tax=unclassified Arthrobacter TaxID=235627 RepID=UPI0014917212|nr:MULTISPECIES: hypothetical protein [unclassified Arthrobacter]NOJ59678.1 hypothetical protein [Arthrobacter sp. 260]NOJ63269.1 hypothetical protein [Arthrobacter sp. 147(2020)]